MSSLFGGRLYRATDDHPCPICDGNMYPNDQYLMIVRSTLYVCERHQNALRDAIREANAAEDHVRP